MQKYILKQLTAFLFLLPLTALAQTDTTYTFRFMAQGDMFLALYGENSAELARLAEFINQNRTAIAQGRISLYVDGSCNSMPTAGKNLAVARKRSNRVKSELILHQGLKEEYFVTHNHTDRGNFVTIRVPIPVVQTLPATDSHDTENEPNKAERLDESGDFSTSSADKAQQSEASSLPEDRKEVNQYRPEPARRSPGGFSLRANVLHWVTLTPDVGLEWRISGPFAILLNGSWTSWSWDNANRRYALWKVAPEVRYYVGKNTRAYLGLMYHIGQFNYKPGHHTGRQGDYQGGGITGGYRMKLTPSLDLDFHAGFGYTRAEYDRYNVADGVRMLQGSKTKSYWGINQLGISLVWLLN